MSSTTARPPVAASLADPPSLSSRPRTCIPRGRDLWRSFDLARDSTGSLPDTPGLVRVTTGTADDREWLVLNIREWVCQMREDLIADGKEPARHIGITWRQDTISNLTAVVGTAQRPSALAPGRPLKVNDPLDAPDTWGLYRIYREIDDGWYVGISSNLRRRLRDHVRSGLFDPAHGYAEVIRVRDGQGRPVVWHDLQVAERGHIDRLRKRGLTVHNITAGGNGRPPGLRVNLNADRGGITVIAAPRNPIQQTRERHLDLGIRWRQPTRDWDLTLRSDNTICAIPGSHGTEPRPGGDVPFAAIRELYEHRHHRSLSADLTELARSQPPDEMPVLFWTAARSTRADGKQVLDIDSLRKIRGDDVAQRTLPDALLVQGLQVDPAVRRDGGLNHVIRVTGSDTTGTYLKTEENVHAVNAEVIASAILNGLHWVGIGDRVSVSESGSVLMVPELGTANVRDLGTLQDRYAHLPNEDAKTMACQRARWLKRVTMADLSLRVPMDVLHLLLFDAAICNTDRNRTNINIGLDLDAPAGVQAGRLLPLDHGRSLFNCDPGSPGLGAVTPIDSLLGNSRYGVPNQLLRPSAELIARTFEVCREQSAEWLQRLAAVTVEINNDWATHNDEFQFILANIAILQADLSGLLDQISLTVLS